MNTLKRLTILIGLVLTDFLLIVIMRRLTPNLFALRVSIIVLLAFFSMACYFFIVKPAGWLRESIFVSVVLTGLALVLTLILHGLIDRNLSVKNFVVSLIASVIPFICGGFYGVLTRRSQNVGSGLS